MVLLHDLQLQGKRRIKNEVIVSRVTVIVTTMTEIRSIAIENLWKNMEKRMFEITTDNDIVITIEDEIKEIFLIHHSI